MLRRKRDDAVDIRGADRHALGVRRHAAVAGQRVNSIYPRVFAQLFQQRVFAPAAANDHEIHTRFPIVILLYRVRCQ
ncbi:hypothetical protein SDC9_132027 [bioreactor metagenome]|uniref:Uncharacterized protein n=1 Tax=bioreactor metagenome TaxID=1076179 RepID=A0A645D6R5_9ZZZZ